MQLIDLISGFLSHRSSPLHASVKGHRTDFLRIGEDLLRKARRRKQSLSVVVFDLSDLPELECVFGRRVAKDVIASFAVRLGKIAATGLATRPAPTVFTLLLPDVDCEDALDLIYETFGKPCRIEFNTGEEETALVPKIVVRDLATETMPLEQALKSLYQAVAEVHIEDQRKQRHLQQERESHSKRMPLARAGAATKPPPANAHHEVCYSPLPATIPAPMGLR